MPLSGRLLHGNDQEGGDFEVSEVGLPHLVYGRGFVFELTHCPAGGASTAERAPPS